MSSLTSKVKDGWARWKLAHFYMRDIQDVDVSSTLPVDGDTLVWVDADKKWEPIASGGFDPNEDPVIIGALSTGGGGSTPSTLAGAHLHIVALGYQATVSGDYGVAAGYQAKAGDHSVVIGWTSDAHLATYATIIGPEAIVSGGDSCVAVGSSATINAGGDQKTAVGGGSLVRNSQGTALGGSTDVGGASATGLGYGAVTAFARSTAVGAFASTTVADQVMLGALDASFVEVCRHNSTYGSVLVMKSPNGTRYALQVDNSGVLSVIASPV